MIKISILLLGLGLYVAASAQRQHSVYNIVDFGAIGDGVTVNTQAIQRAADSCARQGGGSILIPPGNFVTGSVRLFSNMELRLEAGARLMGSPGNKDYGRQQDFGFDGMGAGSRTGILFARNAENIAITGEGNIDGQGDQFVYADSLQNGGDFDRKFTRQGGAYGDPKFGGPMDLSFGKASTPTVLA